MEPLIIALISGSVSAVISGLVGHHLGRRAVTSDRRREARIALRKLADEALSHSAIRLPKTHAQAVRCVRELQLDLATDLGWLARRKLNTRCAAFLALPASIYLADHKPEYKTDEDRRLAWRALCTRLCRDINHLAEAL